MDFSISTSYMVEVFVYAGKRKCRIGMSPRSVHAFDSQSLRATAVTVLVSNGKNN